MLRFWTWCFLNLVFGAVSLTATAQEPVKPSLSPRIITATRQANIFTALETQLLKAIQAKDKTTINSLVSDDCMIEMPDADPLPAEDWTASLVSKDFTLKSFVIRQLSVLDQGETAIVKFDRIQKATWKSAAEDGEFFVVDVWKKSGDSWKLANRYVSKVGSVPWMPKGDVKPTGKQ